MKEDKEDKRPAQPPVQEMLELLERFQSSKKMKLIRLMIEELNRRKQLEVEAIEKKYSNKSDFTRERTKIDIKYITKFDLLEKIRKKLEDEFIESNLPLFK